MTERRRLAIVGGGIAGLSAALFLDRAIAGEGLPLEVRLFESREVTGGVIRTETRDGFLMDLGPDSLFRAKPAAAALARELGLGDQLIDANRQETATLLWGRGGLHPLPDGLELVAPSRILPLITTGLFSPVGKIRMMMEPFIPPRRDGADESIAGFVRRRLGGEAVRRIAGPLMAGIHAGDPERLSLKATFPRLIDIERKHGSLTMGMRKLRAQMAAARKGKSGPPAGPPFVSFRAGLQTLTDTMTAALRHVMVSTGSPVESLSPSEDGYDLLLGGGEAWKASACLLAVPSWAAARLVRSFAGPLAAALEKVRYVSTATVFLGFPRGAGVSIPPSTGFLVPRGEGRSFFGCTFVTNKFSGRSSGHGTLLRAFVGGAGDEAALERSDGELVEGIRGDLRDMIGLTAEPSVVRVQRWERANPQYEVGHEDVVAEVDRHLEDLPGLLVTGSGLRGVGVPDGVDLGREAADSLLKFASQPSAARKTS